MNYLKKIIVALLTLAAFNCGAAENNECCGNHLYLSGFGGFNIWEQNKNNVGLTSGLALGYRFDTNIRIEAEFAYRYNPTHVYHLRIRENTYSVMGNLYYDFDLGCAWVPYIGGGAGYQYTESCGRYYSFFHEYKWKQTKESICYQGIAGISLAVFEKTHLALEYRAFASKHCFRDHSVVVSFKQFF